MSLLSLTGTLVEGPPTACDDAFPAGSTDIPFELNTGACGKQVGASTGRQLLTLNSPAAFVTLSGVGPGQTVTQALTAYLRVRTGGFQFRVTYNGFGVPALLPSSGLFIHEADQTQNAYITKIEVQGAGQLEYYASGLQ